MCSGNEKHFSEEVTRRNLSYDKRKNFSIRRAGTRLLNLSLNIYRTKEHWGCSGENRGKEHCKISLESRLRPDEHKPGVWKFLVPYKRYSLQYWRNWWGASGNGCRGLYTCYLAGVFNRFKL